MPSAASHDALGRIERRLDEQLGGVAAGVLLLVGDDLHALLLDLARRRVVTAGDPERAAWSGSGGPSRRRSSRRPDTCRPPWSRTDTASARPPPPPRRSADRRSFATYLPFSYSQSSRTVLTSIFAPTALLPSRSTPITSRSNGVPLSTNGFLVFRPTYSDAGWTINAAAADQVWRLTSVTDALAATAIGIAGFTDRKSRCSVCAPVASVVARELPGLGRLVARYPPPPSSSSY